MLRRALTVQKCFLTLPANRSRLCILGNGRKTGYWCESVREFLSAGSALPLNTVEWAFRRHYQCGQCNRSFQTEQGLRQHERSKHSKLKHRCGYCARSFDSRLALEQHMHSKHPQSSKCPACGQTRFRSVTGAIQHLESGQCKSCQGKENARNQVYQAIRPHLSSQNQPLLASSSTTSSCADPGVPAFPYSCHHCSKKFKELNSMMQHMAAKHNNRALSIGTESIRKLRLIGPTE